MIPAFYISIPAPGDDSVYDQIKSQVTAEKCRALEPVVIGAQVYDLINTQRVMQEYPERTEKDWLMRPFTGKSHRNVLGLAVGMGILDFVKERLTRHSAFLHCAALVNQLTTNLQAIGVTNRK